MHHPTALIVIDVQQGFDDPFWGRRNNPNLETNIAKILQHWRAQKQPVYIVQHWSKVPNLPLTEGTPGCELKDGSSAESVGPRWFSEVTELMIQRGLQTV